MDVIVALLIGTLIGWLIGRRRAPRDQADLARAWQEGYDAGSLTAPAQAAASLSVAPAWERAGTIEEKSPAPALTPSEARWAAPHAAGQPVPPPPRPDLPQPPSATPEELAQEKRRRDHRNVNITLYTACLLLVAAASLFIGSALPASARVVGLIVVTALFYVGGLVVHAVSSRLRPAATAFTGTGLALLPIVGVALDVLVLDRPAVSWLIVSAVGTALMVVAAARLRSRVVAYLAVPFLLSTVIAAGPAVQQGMVWGLTASIVLSTLMAWLTAGEDRVRWMPEQFQRALADTHHWITPGVILLSVALGAWLEPVHFAMLLLAAAAYYVTVAVLGGSALRLAASYAARLCITGAAGALLWMVEASPTLWTGVLGVVLGAQVLLTAAASRSARGGASGLVRSGFLPWQPGLRVDQLVCLVLLWFLALAGQAALGARPAVPVSLAWAVLVGLAVLMAVLGVLTTTAPERRLAWQAAVPAALAPGLVLPVVDSPWRAIGIVAMALAVQVVIVVLLRRRGTPGQLDVRLAPELAALIGLRLAWLLTEQWSGSDPVWPGAVVAVLAVGWAASRAVRPGEPEHGVDAASWAVFSAIALGALAWRGLGEGESGLLQALCVAVMLVVAVGSLWWLARRPARRTDPPQDEASTALTLPLGLILVSAALVLSGGWLLLVEDGGPWLGVLSMVLIAAWATAVALISATRLDLVLRIGAMLAGQVLTALAVATVVDLLGADAAAARAAAAVTLAAGLVLRHAARRRSRALAVGRSAVWAVAAGIGVLWVVELATTGDRAALTVIALSGAVAAAVLGPARGGPWAALAVVLTSVTALSDLWPLRDGGWLPDPLLPASAAAAVLLLVMLKLVLDEARADQRTAGRFRPVAQAVLWITALVCALTPATAPGVLALAAVTAGLALYVLARTRDLVLLALGTVVTVPAAAAFALTWTRDRLGGDLPTEWWPAVVGTVSLAVLWSWAALDRRGEPQGAGDRAVLLRYGGWAALLLGGLASTAGTEDAVVLTGCLLTAQAAWLLVLWWRGPAGAVPASWSRHALDGAVLVSVLMGLRAWWQTAENSEPVQASWWSMQVLAVALAAVAAGHLRDRTEPALRRRRAVLWGCVAAGVLTAAAALVLVDGTALMQLLSLLGFAALLTVGLVGRVSIFTWWGAAGVTAAVLWYLRGYTVLWLTLLGLVLIAVAVRQLIRGGRDQDQPGRTDDAAPHR